MQKKFALVTEYTEAEIKAIISEIIKETLQQHISQLPSTTSNSPPVDSFVSRKDVCKILRLSVQTVALLQKQGVIKASIVGKSYRYSEKHIRSLIK